MEVWPKAIGFVLLDNLFFRCTAGEHEGSESELPTSSLSLPSYSPRGQSSQGFFMLCTVSFPSSLWDLYLHHTVLLAEQFLTLLKDL